MQSRGYPPRPLPFEVATAAYSAYVAGVGHGFVPVRTSVGVPKFAGPAAREWPRCDELVPWGLLGNMPESAFTARYRARLEKIGADRIRESLIAIHERHGHRPLMLLCFEPAGAFCHRRLVADLWQEWTGQTIDEHEPDPRRSSARARDTRQECTDPHHPRQEVLLQPDHSHPIDEPPGHVRKPPAPSERDSGPNRRLGRASLEELQQTQLRVV
jgi:hypothetical protein